MNNKEVLITSIIIQKIVNTALILFYPVKSQTKKRSNTNKNRHCNKIHKTKFRSKLKLKTS